MDFIGGYFVQSIVDEFVRPKTLFILSFLTASFTEAVLNQLPIKFVSFHITEDGIVNVVSQILYFGSIWELCVLDLKTKVFCRKENQLLFPMDKRLTVPK